MTGKIFRSIMAAAWIVLLCCTVIILGVVYEHFTRVQTDQLWVQLEMAAAGVEAAGTDYLTSLGDADSRLTWIAADGTVLCDTHSAGQDMENHADREEVQQALRTGEGYAVRHSRTLLEKTVYCARRLSDGTVLRIAFSSAGMALLVLGMLRPICIVIALALLVAFLLARHLAGRIVAPLNELDLEQPPQSCVYEELTPLLRRLDRQHRQIQQQLTQLQRKQDEFEQITASMNEGLVLLDDSGTILSINPAARTLLQADTQAVGQKLLAMQGSRELEEAVTLATEQGHSEITIRRDGRVLQIDGSTIRSGGVAIGMVLLIFDITQRADAERARREFTANVSHELKTPLTAILGSSEMLQTGMVKPEDTPRFIGHIHREAARLLTLIEDILRLSQLDEGVALPSEQVDLAAAALETAGQLQPMAQSSNVTLTVETQPCVLPGVSRLVQEILRNLTENAIKYNIPGGSVTLRVTSDGVLTVADTGIGIAPEHQGRVFERFYRVDKSHSRQIGGTGLGLSIVKHAALQLGALIDLQSTPGQGTTVQVFFPTA